MRLSFDTLYDPTQPSPYKGEGNTFPVFPLTREVMQGAKKHSNLCTQHPCPEKKNLSTLGLRNFQLPKSGKLQRQDFMRSAK